MPEAIAAICAGGFILVLALAAYWDPTIRVLQVAEALPYVAAAALSLRRRTVGYALGLASGGFWLWTASFRTTVVRNGFERAAILFRTGRVERPDILIAAPAAIFAGGLALCGVAAYVAHAVKRSRDVLMFPAALVAVALFFLAIFALFAPRYLGIFGL